MNGAPALSSRFREVVFPDEVRRHKAVGLDCSFTPALLPEKETPLPLEHARFLRWLFAQAALDAGAYRTETLERRLPACLRALRAGSVGQARRMLEGNPSLLPTAVSAMLVGVTSFFRDAAVFDLLREQVLPCLAASRGRLCVWSAGVSEGAELYSIALILAEMGRLETSYLLGTDCRSDAIERAHLGLFDSMAVKGVPSSLLARYFVEEQRRWRVVPRLLRATRWKTGDILKGLEPGIWDLILFRNTAMYLRGEAALRLWEKLEGALRPGGVLVLGKAEKPVAVKKLLPLGPSLYRRSESR